MATPFPQLHVVPAREISQDLVGRWEGRLFGNFRLIGPDGANATPPGRKARALLAFLLSMGEDGAARDRLGGLLWSERGEDQARASLRQALYELRALTSGEAPLLAIDRTRAYIVARRIATDVARIDASVLDDDAIALAEAVSEQPPEFLADLDDVDPAFDDWLLVERTRRRELRRRALLAVAERRLALGDSRGAEQLADRLLTCDAADEAAARVAMQASHLRGDRDGVRHVFVRLQDVLQRQIGAPVSSETVEVHRRLMAAPLARESGRLVVAAPNVGDLSTTPVDDRNADIASDQAIVTTAGARAWHTRARVWAIAGLGCACVCLALGLVASRTDAPGATRTLLVDPLRASATDSAALALATGLSADLARLIVGNDGTLRVVDAPPKGPGPGLSGWFLVGGEARSDAGLLHATIRLSRDSGGPILWSRTFTRPAGDVEALREQMASKLGDVAICALGRTNPGAASFSAEAMRLLLGGCDQKQLPDYPEAVKLFRQLVALRPDFAHGWALLAFVEQLSASDSPAAGEAEALGADAERSAQRALALDPNDADAYFARALGMHGIALWQERMAVLMHGHVLDPLNGRIDNAIAWDLKAVGRWGEAAVFDQQAVKVDPFSTAKTSGLIYSLGRGGDLGGAVEALADARKRFGKHRVIAWTDFDFNALVGDPRRAQAILDDPGRGFVFSSPDRVELWSALVAERIAPSPASDARVDRAIATEIASASRSSTLVVELLARRNRVDEAFAFIERLRPDEQDGLGTATLFGVPTKPLRDDPRFMTVAARRGLVSVWERTGHWPDFCLDPSLRYDCRKEAQRAVSPDPRPLVATRK